jgi:hypothetical protein
VIVELELDAEAEALNDSRYLCAGEERVAGDPGREERLRGMAGNLAGSRHGGVPGGEEGYVGVAERGPGGIHDKLIDFGPGTTRRRRTDHCLAVCSILSS